MRKWIRKLYWKWRAARAMARFNAICAENARCREIVRRGLLLLLLTVSAGMSTTDYAVTPSTATCAEGCYPFKDVCACEARELTKECEKQDRDKWNAIREGKKAAGIIE